jgi:hypothetical protein
VTHTEPDFAVGDLPDPETFSSIRDSKARFVVEACVRRSTNQEPYDAKLNARRVQGQEIILLGEHTRTCKSKRSREL